MLVRDAIRESLVGGVGGLVDSADAADGPVSKTMPFREDPRDLPMSGSRYFCLSSASESDGPSRSLMLWMDETSLSW
jgi:hypothetical protein